jgi:hypothetical protein
MSMIVLIGNQMATLKIFSFYVVHIQRDITENSLLCQDNRFSQKEPFDNLHLVVAELQNKVNL